MSVSYSGQDQPRTEDSVIELCFFEKETTNLLCFNADDILGIQSKIRYWTLSNVEYLNSIYILFMTESVFSS